MIDGEKMNTIIRDGYRMMMSYCDYFKYNNKEVNEYFMVPTILTMKILRLHDAILKLVESNFEIEACIVAISQFEAKIDLMAAICDPNWCTSWVKHVNQRESATKNITRSIREGFSNDPDLGELELTTYRILSMIKHGNPAASELSFPVRRDGTTITVSTHPAADEFASMLGKMISSYSACQVAWAFQVFQNGLGEYVICDPAIRDVVRGHYDAVGSFGVEFNQWAESLVLDRSGHLGIARDLDP